MDMRLLHKFLVIFIALAVIPLGLSNIIAIKKSQEALEKEIADKELGFALQASARVNEFISNAVAHLKTATHVPGFENMNPEFQRLVLINLMDSYPLFEEMSVIDENGMEIVKVSKYAGIGAKDLRDNSMEDHYLTAITGRTYIGEVEISEKRHSVVDIAVPIALYKDRYIGVLSSKVNLDSMSDMLFNIDVGDGGVVYVVDPEGRLIIHPDKKKMVLHENMRHLPIVEEVLSGKTGTIEFIGNGGEEMLGAYIPVKMTGWGVIVQQPKHLAYKPVAEMRNTAFMWILTSLIIAIFLGIAVSYGITKPIKELVTGAREIGKGNLRHKIALDSRDEIGELAESFNTMAKDLLVQRTELVSREKAFKRSIREIETVHEIDQTIIKKLDLSLLLKFIVQKAKELTGADATFYSFVEEDEIRHHTFLGIRTKEFKNIRLKKGKGLGWLAIKKKKPVVVEDFFTDERLVDPPYEAVRKEGLISILAVPFISGKGEALGVLYVANRRKTGFTTDQVRTLVTLAGQASVAIEHVRLYEETKRAYDELKTLDELKSNIIANVSHELRTPITIAKGALELVREEKKYEKRDELLSMALEAIRRQNFIIGNLIEAARLGKVIGETKHSRVDLAEVITHVSNEFVPIAAKNRIDIKVEIEKELPIVLGSRNQLMHVIRNLLHNAVKFNKIGGEVTVKASKKGKHVKVCVIDTGIGIPADKLENIFDRFYQVDSSSTRRYGGTGMGLAIVKEIIESHRGRVSVESELGTGSKFCFIVRIAEN